MNRLNRLRKISFFASVCLLMLLAGCARQEPIKIGFAASLTGITSELGVSGRNGAQLAVDEINRSGGIKGQPLQLLIKDDLNSPATAIKGDQELIAAGAVAIIGHFTSNTNMAVMPTIDQQKIVLISPTVSTELLSGLDDYFFRVIGSNRLQAEVLANAASHQEKITTAAVIYDQRNLAYSGQIYQGFRIAFAKNGGQVILAKAFSSGSGEDFEKLAQELVASGAEGVVISASGADTALICQQIRKISSRVKIFSGMWGMTGDLIKNGGPAVEGIYLAGIYDRNSDEPSFLRFRHSYQAAYGEEASFSALLSFETVQILAQVLAQSKDFQPRSLKSTLTNIGEFSGLGDGMIQIDQYGDAQREYHLFKIRNKSFLRIEQ